MPPPLIERLIARPAAWFRRLDAAGPAVVAGARRPAGYPRHWESRARLADGRPVALRPILPADAPALEEGFLRLSPEDVRRRFGQAMGKLSPDMLAHLTRIDYRDHMALVALDPASRGTADGWGVARYVTTREPPGAELAITVRSDMQRLGIGSLLLARLLAFAAAQGVGVIWGDVLSDNAAMLSLARKFGFSVEPSPESPKLSRIWKRLDRAPHQALA